MNKSTRTSQGLFITLEGVDGCGKSTQASLLREDLEALGFDVVFVREPGGTAISEQIRGVVLNPENGMMCDECELLLYEASRAQLVGEVIRPALAAGKVVLCDRFYDSTYAYQAAGRGLDTDLVHRANCLGSCGVFPDRTLVFMLEPTVAHARATQNDADRLEAEG
ncbi:MAG: dTMP kinase, partial [Atopobium sp.]|nr:dTMP kinase [Atopobium sp.]